jgi:hypothetical protein
MPAQFGQPSLPTVSKTMAHFCERPSPSISELALGEFDPNDHLVSAAFEALKSCRVAAHSTHAACAAVHSDQTLSEGARHVSPADVANKVTARPLPLVDAAGSKISAEITRIENKIKQPPIDNTIRACQVATELRLFLRDQSPADRCRTITKTLEVGDDQILSAVLSAPPCLSGLSDTEVAGFALIWRQRKFPDELKRIAALEKAAKALYLGGTHLASYATKMANPGVVAEARRLQKTTADAVRAATGVQ